MSSDNLAVSENLIAAAIEAAEDIHDPLDRLVEKTATDPSAPFAPDALEGLATLKKEDRAAFEALRAQLKKAGCRVTVLDQALAEENGDSGRRSPTQADILIELAQSAELFHAPDMTGFADLDINGHRETWPIRAKGFRRWLARRFFEETRGAPSSEALQSALNVIEAKAHFDAPERLIHVRVGGLDGRLYLDLCDETWRRHVMGGFGSGRPSGSGRGKVESYRSIDVYRLHKAGCLRPGWWGGWQWTRDGEKVASITLRVEATRLHLSYRVRIDSGEWEDVEETVRIVRVPCRFGGSRPYFICPGVMNGISCRRRVTKLHVPGRYFLCRHCYRLAHASQSESAWDRAVRRATKIRQRLGGDPDIAEPFPKKPKGMWQRTYNQLTERAFKAEAEADDAFVLSVGRLLARIDKSDRKKDFWR